MSNTSSPLAEDEVEARPKLSDSKPINERGRFWCPECDGELSDAQDDYWHHFFGERGECTWTD